MARARKPTRDDKKLAVDTSRFGFEDEEEFRVGLYEGNNPNRPHKYLKGELDAVSLPSLFTPEVCDKFEKEFDLTGAQVAELSRRVEASLDPDLNPLVLAVAQSDGERRGTAAVERGFVALSDAQERILDALSALAPLRAIADDGDARRTMDSVIKTVEECQACALEALIILDGRLRHSSLFYEPVVADKRQVDAARRTVVIAAIIEFWVWMGLKPTYTTNSKGVDKHRPRRTGRLIDLCHAVCRLARKDGRTYSGDTIADEIKAWRNR